MKRKRVCYIGYSIDLDLISPVNLSFRLFEMLGLKENIYIEFFRMTDDYFLMDQVKKIGYDLKTDSIRDDIKYLSFESDFDILDLPTIVNLEKFDDAQCITYTLARGNLEYIESLPGYKRYDKLLKDRLIDACFSVDIEGIDIYLHPDYYLENKDYIDKVLQEFEETYKEYVYHKYVKIKL